jgi:hypothetical protein
VSLTQRLAGLAEIAQGALARNAMDRSTEQRAYDLGRLRAHLLEIRTTRKSASDAEVALVMKLQDGAKPLKANFVTPAGSVNASLRQLCADLIAAVP